MKILFISLFLSIITQASVWVDTKSWSIEEENKYQAWVKSSLKKDIFSNPQSKYYDIKTDCADAIYALRAIYAFENSLPFQFKDPTKFLGNDLITNRSSSFDKTIDPVKRLKKFLHFWFPHLGTTTLRLHDSLPVLPSSLKAGNFFVAPTTQTDSNGEPYKHAHLIKNLSNKGYYHLLSSTVPAAVRSLKLIKGFPKSKNILENGWGFKRFLWKEDYKHNISQKNLTSVNSSQYENYIKEYTNEVFKNFIITKEPFEELIDRKFENICELLEQRIQEINRIAKLLESNPRKYLDKNSCIKKDAYGVFSTPSRDKDIYKEITDMYSVWDATSQETKDTLSLGYLSLIDKLKTYDQSIDLELKIPEEDIHNESLILLKGSKNIPSLCAKKINDRFFHVSDFINRYTTKISQRNQNNQKVWSRNLSANPNDSFDARWGLTRKRSTCPNYDEYQEIITF